MDNVNKASRVRISCDPFRKEITYEWYDSNMEEYVEFDPENSKLVTEEFVHATIQNRAYEIVNKINEECNVGNVGLKIIFIGTENDYDDICEVINTYYANANIECVRDKRYFNLAGTVMPQIKDIFSGIEKTLEAYSEDEIKDRIYRYRDAVKPSISLCMMGLYSAGKSAFINSIIGAEILPSASEPETARVCKIYCDNQNRHEIKFDFDGKECVLTFKEGTYKPNSNFDTDIIKDLQNILKTDEHHDEIYHMNRALGILNKYPDDQHKMGKIIEIKIPFRRTSLPTEEFEFVIYDTPGSNSSKAEHFEVLKSSLDEQTNTLPIFLTTPDSMDAEDNEKLLKLIEETGDALDTTNAIVVINKADEKGGKTLREKKEKCRNLKITKWKSTRIFFLSSLIAMASKKENPDDAEEWLDEEMYEFYDEKKTKYLSDERKLFEFNIVDKSRAFSEDDYPDEKKSTHLYWNSGLAAIEKEIEEYARKYALYNKCQQASVYLQDAIELCVKKIEEAESEQARLREEEEKHFDSKRRELSDNLKKKEKNIAIYNTQFQELIENCYVSFAKENRLRDIPDDKSY